MTEEIPQEQRPACVPPSYRGWKAWAAIATVALPVVMILLVAFSPDDEATESAVGILDDLAVIEMIAIGLGLGPFAILWSIRRKSPAVRWTLFVVFAFVGFIVGLIGSIGVAWARHPTWDDA